MKPPLFSKNCYYCGHRLALFYRYRWCPHIAFCKKPHSPRTQPWCDFCEQERSPSTPTEHLHLTCDPTLFIHRPKAIHYPFAQARSSQKMLTRQATAQAILPERCYTCKAKLTEPEAYRLCPHIVFCAVSCTPCGQPMCYEC